MIWTIERLRKTSSGFEEWNDVPVIDVGIWTHSTSNQLPHHDSIRPLKETSQFYEKRCAALKPLKLFASVKAETETNESVKLATLTTCLSERMEWLECCLLRMCVIQQQQRWKIKTFTRINIKNKEETMSKLIIRPLSRVNYCFNNTTNTTYIDNKLNIQCSF